MSDYQPALNSTSFKNKPLTFIFQDTMKFPFYDKETEYDGKNQRRIGYKIDNVRAIEPSGEVEDMVNDTVFLTEKAHELIVAADCKPEDEVTLLLKSGQTKEGRNYTIWLLGKGLPAFNDHGSTSNLNSTDDWLAGQKNEVKKETTKTDDKIEMDSYATGETKAVEPAPVKESSNLLLMVDKVRAELTNLEKAIGDLRQEIAKNDLPF